jgi:hypothetical protein
MKAERTLATIGPVRILSAPLIIAQCRGSSKVCEGSYFERSATLLGGERRAKALPYSASGQLAALGRELSKIREEIAPKMKPPTCAA